MAEEVDNSPLMESENKESSNILSTPKNEDISEKKKKPFSYAIMGLSLVLTAFLKIDAVFVIIGCGLFGLLWSILNRKEQSNGAD